MTRLGYLTYLLGVAAFLDLLVYLASEGFTCDTPEGEACSPAANVSGVLVVPQVALFVAVGTAVLVRRRAD